MLLHKKKEACGVRCAIRGIEFFVVERLSCPCVKGLFYEFSRGPRVESSPVALFREGAESRRARSSVGCRVGLGRSGRDCFVF